MPKKESKQPAWRSKKVYDKLVRRILDVQTENVEKKNIINKNQEEIALLKAEVRQLRELNHLNNNEIKRIKHEEVGKPVYAVPTGVSERRNTINLPPQFILGDKGILPGGYYSLMFRCNSIEADGHDLSITFHTASISRLEVDSMGTLLAARLNDSCDKMLRMIEKNRDNRNGDQNDHPTQGVSDVPKKA